MGMLFSWSIGSSGSGSDRFALYVPFTVSLGCEISSIDREIEHNINGYKVRIEKLINFYAIIVGEFNSIDEAHRFFPKLCSSFLWVSLKLKSGISYPKLITELNIEDAPTKISKDSNFRSVVDSVGWNELDGHYDANKAVVIPDGKKLIKTEFGNVMGVIGFNAENFVKFIAEAISFKSPENIVNDKKLQLAISLYSASHYEVSDNAKFITLVTVIEALKPEEEEVSDIAREALELAISTIEKLKACKKGDELIELENQVKRIRNLMKQGTRKAIRKYISKIIEENSGLGHKKEVSKKIEDIYRIRNALLHSGTADNKKIKEGLHFLVGFIPKLLEWLYQKEVGQQA